jgi:hypothetical protein
MALLDLDRAPHGGSQRHLPEWQGCGLRFSFGEGGRVGSYVPVSG